MWYKLWIRIHWEQTQSGQIDTLSRSFQRWSYQHSSPSFHIPRCLAFNGIEENSESDRKKCKIFCANEKLNMKSIESRKYTQL